MRFLPLSSNQKFKKKFLVKNNRPNYKMNELTFGDFGIKCLKPGIVKPLHFESIYKILKKQLKLYNLKSKFWFNLFPHYSYTKKPIEVRMGKGKGNISFWYAPVRVGSVFLEIKNISKSDAMKILPFCIEKLPVKSKIINRLY